MGKFFANLELIMKNIFIALSFFALVFHLGLAKAAENFEEKTYAVPMQAADGTKLELQTRVCMKPSAKAATVVILNHGSPPSPEDRPKMTAYKCDSEVVQWFLSRGYIVMSPLRRGYGATGGAWAEGFGKCDKADFFHAGLETARDMEAAVNFVEQIPQARKDQVVVVGQSAGGWGSIALNSLGNPKVKAIINMAGGRGGHHGPNHNQNCSPEQLAKDAGQYGASAKVPMLWIYAENDSFFAPAIAKAMHEAFTKAGGKADLIQKPAFGKDGHKQFAAEGGSQVWGQDFEKYLNQTLSSKHE